ncbi:MAG: helix-turn-helix transcriptional regulator, partial [Gordonibacter sp.]|uniref:helix-turn-helix transcriptional regulator n=1 Tax=Gordonibacter sp. TaxID=1968902 RepID=UPI002FCB4FE0
VMTAMISYFLTVALVYFLIRFSRLRKTLIETGIVGDAAFLIVSAIPIAMTAFIQYLHVSQTRTDEIVIIAIAATTSLMGACTSLGMFRWHNSAATESEPMFAYTTWGLSLGLLLFTLVLWLNEAVSSMTFVSMNAISALLYFVLPKCKVKNYRKETKRVDQNVHLDLKMHVALFFQLMAIGFCICATFSSWSSEVITAIVAIAFVLNATLPLQRRYFAGTTGQMARIYLPAGIAMLFGISSNDTYIRTAIFAIAVLLFFYQGHSNISFLITSGRRFDMNILANISKGRFPPMFGFACGLCLGYACLVLQLNFVVAACVIAVFMIGAYTLLPFNYGISFKEGVSYDLKEGIVTPWTAQSEEEERSFKKKCTTLAEQYDFTPREQEIFLLLACGYNSDSIAKMLVISPSTVKTHTYRIYQKIDVHSQQEIIMMLRPQKYETDRTT